ncbi:MAG TPA: hypothetical protein VGX48_19335 [Pyrinomonadaceae bacterium]|jgi:hypothetical protein|nr:hypothetical protein [Pyrinomonadaceae bacterium]
MKRIQMIFLALLATFVCSVVTSAQDIPAPVAKVIEELECKMQKSMPDWKRQRVEPFSKTERVVIDDWSNCGLSVRVAINYSLSEAEAIKGLRRPTASEGKAVPGLGDEAFAWGYNDYIGMRIGDLTFSISAGSSLSLPGVDAGEGSALRRAEEAALNKGFARLISTFLPQPDVRCGELFERYR